MTPEEKFSLVFSLTGLSPDAHSALRNLEEQVSALGGRTEASVEVEIVVSGEHEGWLSDRVETLRARGYLD